LTLLTFSQKKKVENLPKFDEKKLHFGFFIGYNQYDFTIKYKDDYYAMDSSLSILSKSRPGLILGPLCNLRLDVYWDLRFLPGLILTERQLLYKFQDIGNKTVLKTKAIESTFLDFPLIIKYKSARMNNFRTYVFGGAKYSYDLASNKNAEIEGKEVVIKLKRHDIGYEIGVGLDFYLTYFKFSPEFKMSVGTKNMLVRDNTFYTNAIDKLTTKSFSIILTFE